MGKVYDFVELSSGHHLRDHLLKQQPIRLWLSVRRRPPAPHVCQALDGPARPPWGLAGTTGMGRPGERPPLRARPAVRRHQSCLLVRSQGKWEFLWVQPICGALQAGDLMCAVSASLMGRKRAGTSGQVPDSCPLPLDGFSLWEHR